MSISLEKGGNVNLSKEAPGLTKALIGLGWHARTTNGEGFDLDASAFMLNSQDKCTREENLVFYNNLKDPSGAVSHSADDQTGSTDDNAGDAEQITVELAKVPADISKIAVTVTIHKAAERHENFGQVSRAYVRIVDASTEKEVARYDLSEDSSTEDAMIFGELYRNGNDWKFRAVGQGFKSDGAKGGGFGALVRHYGLGVQ